MTFQLLRRQTDLKYSPDGMCESPTLLIGDGLPNERRSVLY